MIRKSAATLRAATTIGTAIWNRLHALPVTFPTRAAPAPVPATQMQAFRDLAAYSVDAPWLDPLMETSPEIIQSAKVLYPDCADWVLDSPNPTEFTAVVNHAFALAPSYRKTLCWSGNDQYR